MKSMTWILMAVCAIGALAEFDAKIAGVVTVTPVCPGGAQSKFPLPKPNEVSVALNAKTFDTYLKPSGSGLVFHVYPVREKVRGTEITFKVEGPSTNAKPGFSVSHPGTYDLVITDLKDGHASEAYPFTIKACPLYQ
jgi:hypothetical protein